MKLVNMTNRDITICDAFGKPKFTLPGEGNMIGSVHTPVPVQHIEQANGAILGVDIVKYEFGHYGSELPPEVEGVMYVVSYAVLQALGRERKDFISPDTSPSSVIHHPGSNRVLGVKRFRVL